MSKISNEMNKIEKNVKFQNLKELQKIKIHMLKEQESVTNKEVLEEFLKLQKKNFTSNFNSTSREQMFMIQRNKTNGPCMGHYQPKKEIVMNSTKNVIINKEHLTARTMQSRMMCKIKSNKEIQNMSQLSKSTHKPLCQHLVKSLNSYAEYSIDTSSPQRHKMHANKF